MPFYTHFHKQKFNWSWITDEEKEIKLDQTIINVALTLAYCTSYTSCQFPYLTLQAGLSYKWRNFKLSSKGLWNQDANLWNACCIWYMKCTMS